MSPTPLPLGVYSSGRNRVDNLLRSIPAADKGRISKARSWFTWRGPTGLLGLLSWRLWQPFGGRPTGGI